MRVRTAAAWARTRGKRVAGGRAGRAVLVVAAIFCVTGCYLSPINRAPVVSINAVGPFQRGQDVQFTATVSDPDGDPVDLSWGVNSGDCKRKDDPSNWPARMAESTYTVRGETTNDTFCVWVFGTDRYGAVGVDNKSFRAGDRPPVATIDLVSPKLMSMYYLGTRFQLQPQASDPDMDEITQYDWSVRLPSGTPQTLEPCDATAGVASARCFQASASGRYVVSLTVSAHGASGTAVPLQLDVHDHIPPCIQDWTHKSTTVSLDPQKNQEFMVLSVLDDGRDDAPGVTYTWFMTPPGALPGTAPVVQDLSFPLLTIDHDRFKVGDTTVIRVEVRDDRPDVVDDILRGCGDAPTCSTTDPITNSECFQRISWNVTWNG